VQIVEGAEGESKEKMVSLLLTASLFPIVSASFLSLTSLRLLLPKY
jgi:nitrate reductase NapE component